MQNEKEIFLYKSIQTRFCGAPCFTIRILSPAEFVQIISKMIYFLIPNRFSHLLREFVLNFDFRFAS